MATEYIVLREITGETLPSGARAWIVVHDIVDAVEAHTPQAAIRAATDGKPAAERSGTFVAVPARSWRPLTRTVDTVEKDVWS